MWKTPGEGDGVRGDSADLDMDIDIDMYRYVKICIDMYRVLQNNWQTLAAYN